MSKCNPYHHGDLRNALIMAAVALIEDSGSADFAMSDAAKRAGVSAAAPYRHFKDRHALLDAVRDLYIIGLGDAAAQTRDNYPEGSRECIIALGQTYTSYVLSRSAFYNLAWSREESGEASAEDTADHPGFQTFIGAVDAWCRCHGLRKANPLDLGIKLWGLAHGLAVLKMNGQLDHFMPGADIHDMLETGANAFLGGVAQEA